MEGVKNIYFLQMILQTLDPPPPKTIPKTLLLSSKTRHQPEKDKPSLHTITTHVQLSPLVEIKS